MGTLYSPPTPCPDSNQIAELPERLPRNYDRRRIYSMVTSDLVRLMNCVRCAEYPKFLLLFRLDKIPEDAIVAGVYFNYETNTLDLVVEHPSFDVVADGKATPRSPDPLNLCRFTVATKSEQGTELAFQRDAEEKQKRAKEFYDARELGSRLGDLSTLDRWKEMVAHFRRNPTTMTVDELDKWEKAIWAPSVREASNAR